ncbi:hypothetical protein appser11_13180 [Actinobacillus pleuropneumoniae serovar 11 str. 56153]|nr:hypothetical protein appser9_13180 [Actinobacillus pleuropneumoniae serovar 9 str. CVJ13261]EFM98320.1 hypothetical protein appser11_13180 [Actinobacillus pleuropneumoniae serovar 11 str. 56153]
MKTVALILYPHFSLFHFAVPQMVFSATGLANEPLFDLKVVMGNFWEIIVIYK